MSRPQLDALLGECADTIDRVDREHLREELGSLLGLVDATAPEPSAELAAVLGLPAPAQRELAAVPPPEGGRGGPAGPATRRRLTGPRGAVTGAVVLAAATVGATGLSAAANSLPAPLQRHVADLSHTYLPFDFPRPRGVLDRAPTSPERPVPGAQPLAPPAPLAERSPGEDARVTTEATRSAAVRRTLPPVRAVAGARSTGAARDTAAEPARPAASPRPTAQPSPTASAPASSSPSAAARPQSAPTTPPRTPSSGPEPRGDGSTSPRQGGASAAPTLAAASPRPGRATHAPAASAAPAEAEPGGGRGRGRTMDGSLPGRDPVKEQREKDARGASGTDEPGGSPDVVAPVLEPLDRTLDTVLDRGVEGPDGSLPAR